MVDDKKLIDLVRMNDHLYNRANPRYSSLKEKRQTWNFIAAELGTRVDIVIKRYRILRDRLVREKRLEVLTGAKTKYRCSIVDRLEFLTPHVFTKNSEGVKIAWSGNVFDPLQVSNSPLPSIFPQELKGIKLDWTGHENNFSQSSADSHELDSRVGTTLGTASPYAKELFCNINNINTSSQSPNSQRFIETQHSNAHKDRVLRKRNSESTSITNSKHSSTSVRLNHDDNGNDRSSINDESFSETLEGYSHSHDNRLQQQESNEAIQGFCQMILATIGAMSGRKQTLSMLKVTEIVMQIKLQADAEDHKERD